MRHQGAWLWLDKPFTGQETAQVQFYGPVQGGNEGGFYWEEFDRLAERTHFWSIVRPLVVFPSVTLACNALLATGCAGQVYRLCYNYRPLLIAQRELIVYHRGVRFGNWFALPWGDF